MSSGHPGIAQMTVLAWGLYNHTEAAAQQRSEESQSGKCGFKLADNEEVFPLTHPRRLRVLLLCFCPQVLRK
jgi:hypothetical protein